MNDDIVSHLRGIPLFTNLDEASLGLLAQNCRRRQFAAKTALFHEGDPGQTLYVLLSGRVSVQRVTATGSVVHLAQRGAGEYFGEMSLLDGGCRSADVVTDESCDVLILEREAFIRCLRASPDIALGIIACLTDRLRQSADLVVSRQVMDVPARLAAFLLETAGVHVGTPAGLGRSGAPCLPPLTEQEIADRIGTTRESVSRTLSRFIEAGAVRRTNRRLVVVTPEKLARRCTQ